MKLIEPFVPLIRGARAGAVTSGLMQRRRRFFNFHWRPLFVFDRLCRKNAKK